MIRRGEIYIAGLDPVTGSEQGGTRPVLVIQNDAGNRCSPTVIVLAITSAAGKPMLPTHVSLRAGEGGLSRCSTVLAEQMRTIDKRRLRDRLGRLDEGNMALVEAAVLASLGMVPPV